MKATLALAAAMATGTFAHAQEAVQWRVEDGGNGHWYALLSTAGVATWPALIDHSASVGAYPATITTASESIFLALTLVQSVSGRGALIGATCTDPQQGDWYWANGEPWSFTNWYSGQPKGAETHAYLLDVDEGYPIGQWDDCLWGYVPQALLEWSADCNADGIVDYGQILDGTFEDANVNGVPDCCDEGVSCDPCVGDVNFDGIVNGADISVLLGFWGLNGKPVAADINKDGQVDGADLAQLLGSWGACS